MNQEIAALEAELKEYRFQLETVQSGLQADPGNGELQILKTELEQVISLHETTIAELKPAPAAAPSKPPSPPPTKEKWSKENHPAFQAGYRKPADGQTIDSDAKFSVNDHVLAKWKSGDKAFYPARITSITGSTSAPVYHVTFKSYATTEMLEAHEIKLVAGESRKRKADGASGSPTMALPVNTNVISAPADINPTLASQAKREPSKVSDGPPKPPKVPRKVKPNKELEAGKSKWHDFTTKGKMSKVAKKDSMFRTPEGVNARVGFTGSGQSMRKDPARSRHVYQQGEEEA